MIDETSANWTLPEDEGWTPAQESTCGSATDEPWTRELDPGLLMGFLSEFRSAIRDQAAAEREDAKSACTVVRRRDPVTSRFEVVEEPEAWEGDPYEGSDRQVTAEWWFASNGRWYPPELHPDRQVTLEPAHQICRTTADTIASIGPVEKERTPGKRFLARNRRRGAGAIGLGA